MVVDIERCPYNPVWERQYICDEVYTRWLTRLSSGAVFGDVLLCSSPWSPSEAKKEDRGSRTSPTSV